jgi:hypothetical protein
VRDNNKLQWSRACRVGSLRSAKFNHGPLNSSVMPQVHASDKSMARSRGDTIFLIVAAVLLVAASVAMLLPSVRSGPPLPRIQCMNNIRLAALGILEYEKHNGHLPPPFTTDASGNRLHSWRALILPYIEERELFALIDFEKPWNHPTNAKAGSMMPDAYRCAAENGDVNSTSFLAVLDPDTIWSIANNRSFRELSASGRLTEDALNRSCMLVESRPFRCHWMAPTDVTLDQLLTDAPQSFTTDHPGFSCIVSPGLVFLTLNANDTIDVLRESLTIQPVDDQ